MTSEQRLMDAIVDCRIYQTRYLLGSGAPAEFVDEEGYSPLLRALAIEDKKHRTRTNLIKLLIEYGADVNTTDSKGHHALAQACLCEKQDIVRLLLATSMHNIDLNKTDNDGDTPLMHAVRNGNVEIVKILVDSMNKFRINMHIRNHFDRTPYLEAVQLGRKECARILLEEGRASTTVQVNPFLGILTSKQNKCEWKEIQNGRSVGWERRDAGQGGVCNEFRHRQVKSAKLSTTRPQGDITLSCDTHKRLFKRKSIPAKVLKKKTKVKTEKVTPLLGIQYDQNNEAIESWSNLDGYLATDINTTETDKPVRRMRPHTALITTSRELERKTNGENYNPSTPRIFSKDDTLERIGSFVPRHHRCKTAPLKHYSSLSSLDTESGVLSWHSHFTVCSSPSVNFLNKMMNLYGEQLSPDSSYRKGIKPRKTEDPNAPAIVEPDEHDKRSDGRRSSSGSIRSISSGNRNRFSSLSRTVASCISSKKAFSGLKSKN